MMLGPILAHPRLSSAALSFGSSESQFAVWSSIFPLITNAGVPLKSGNWLVALPAISTSCLTERAFERH